MPAASPAIDPSEHAADVDVDGAGGPAEGDRHDGARRVRADAREGFEGLDRVRHLTAMVVLDRPGGSMQSQRRGGRTPRPCHARSTSAGVAAASAPTVGKRAMKRCQCVGRAGRLRLLGHRLRNEDGVGVGRPAEGQRPAVLGVPGEDRVARRARERRLTRSSSARIVAVETQVIAGVSRRG